MVARRSHKYFKNPDCWADRAACASRAINEDRQMTNPVIKVLRIVVNGIRNIPRPFRQIGHAVCMQMKCHVTPRFRLSVFREFFASHGVTLPRATACGAVASFHVELAT